MVTLREPSRRILVGTAGHIDHGKTKLVKLFTGCETDRLPEEKKRGMSIDLGFASCMLGKDMRLGIVDVPGHEKFIRNMVAGVSAIDMIILVVAADDGVMPQTREHIQIVELLGLEKGLVALTKIDMVDEEMRELALEDVKQFIQGTFLEDAPIVPISSETGEGFEAFWDALRGVADSIEPRGPRGVFRMPVERTFSVKGLGTVVTGMPLTGEVKLEEKLELLPKGKAARVRGMQVFSRGASRAMAGDCVALNLPDVDRKEVHRGQVLAQPGMFKPSTLVDARLTLLQSSPHALKDGAPVRFHVGTSEVLGRVALLDRKRADPGASLLVQFRLKEPVVVDAMDRFVIRLQSPVVTVGGGHVIREQERKLKRYKAYVLKDLEEQEIAIKTDEGALAFALKKQGAKPAKKKELAKASRLPDEVVEKGLAVLEEKGLLVTLPGDTGYLHRASLDDARAKVGEILGAFHDENPFRSGTGRPGLRSAAGIGRIVFDHLIKTGEKEGMYSVGEGVVGLKARQPSLNAEAKEDLDRLEKAFLEAAFSPPSPVKASEDLGRKEADVHALLGLLCDRGALVEVAEGIVFHRETLARAEETLVSHLKEHGEIGAVTFRDLVGASRKFVYPLLDHFDVKGVTVRRGNLRYLKGKGSGEVGA